MRRLGFLVVAGFSVLGAGLSVAEESAQSIIFDASHLSNAPVPGDITYSYTLKTPSPSEYGTPVDEQVRVHVERSVEPDRWNASVERWSGENHRDPVTFLGQKANPVILMFLEQDLFHMARKVGGSSNALRARMAAAFRTRTTIDTVTAKYDGHDVKATRISMAPFAKDPAANELGAYVRKVYQFIFSDEVPGQVVELIATTPGEKQDEPPLSEEKVEIKQAAASQPKGAM